MRRHLQFLETRAMLGLLGKIAVASVVLGAVCWAGSHWLLADWAAQHFWPKLMYLIATICAGALAFFSCASALGVGELVVITSAVKRRLRR
jgi:peptidoglycan biosynthesis protein MviN/MurJ (putative lipid II flippase)